MAETVDIFMPLELEGTTATVRSWLKKIGDEVRRDEPLLELETDKVTTEVPAPADGILAEILLDTDAGADPGSLLGRLTVGVAATGEAIEGPPIRPAGPTLEVGEDSAELRLSPAVRRAVVQHGIDPARLRGTGRKGRVTRADVDRFIEQRDEAPKRPSKLSQPGLAVASPSTISTLSGGQVIAVDRMRRAIADNMLASVTAAPHVTAIFEADLSAIMAHRSKNKAAFEAQGAALTYTTYFVAASVAAMRASPLINARWHGDAIEIFDSVNVGVGTALGERGLVVPVVHDAGSLSLLGIARRLHDMTARARDGTLKPEDVKNGTFTISNHGVSGSLLAAPIIILQPQSAILGIGKVEKRVVVREVGGADTIQIRPMAYVSLTIDHRIVDGHQTNLWLSQFVSTLEAWPH